ncbi:MAG TPA: hypothetical protein VHQ65_11305, partial [Thermoanaerobaculia bacterium]|nr:hypothetical protein [Thermoanaerobaculia bacterium]
HTPYATQNQSIRHQLDFGIRLLDVRIQVAQDGSRYTFTTCHGDIGSDHGINLYQSLPSLLGECRDFLGRNPSEVVLLSLKVDDWSNTKSRQEALAALQDLLNEYPVKTAASLPTLGTTRGHIFLFNRINDDLALGTPISWSDNTTGSYAKASSNRGYPVYVQDRYKDLPTVGADAEKLRLVIAAFDHKPSSAVVWNFASATWYGVFGVYIQGDLLSYFGKDEAADRLENFGWTLFDYPFSSYDTTTYGSMNIVSLIISSNFGYLGYEKKFKVLGEG